MPKDFTTCVARGGRVRTIKRSGASYQHLCFDSKGSHAGEMKRKKGGRGKRPKPY